MTAERWVSATFLCFVLVAACGAPPPPSPPSPEPKPANVGKRRRDIPDDCQQEPGKPAPEPLRMAYSGVAKAAQCQRAVYTIMGGLTHFLGVECRHCHLEPDYAADTHNKQIANWMARELVPRLQTRVADAGGEHNVWCQDCHAGKPKLLGDPRRRDVAIEWMTTHLSEDFDTLSGKSPKCKECHGGDVGSPEFRSKIILSDLNGLPAPAVAPPVSEPAPSAPSEASAPVAPPAVAPAPAPSVAAPPPIPDFGKR